MSETIKELVVKQTEKDIVIKEYTKGIFFDNEQKYIDSVSKAFSDINCIKVNETNYGNKWDWQNKITDDKFKSDYIDKNELEYNSLYKLLLEKQTSEDKTKFPFYDPKLRCDIDSGLDNKSKDDLDKWIGRIKDGEKYCALFDWDRTISQIEFIWSRGNLYNVDKTFEKTGYFVHPLFDDHPIDNTITDEEYLEFLCGGKTRLALLRSMMDKCKDNNIDIIVLTNNINCRLISNECIVLFNALIGKIPESSKSEIRIICASDTDPRFDKVKAIRSKCHFVDTVKSVSGGGKIKKNKVKSKKNKVKSKKNKAKSKKIK
jgi:hypothetical protein